MPRTVSFEHSQVGGRKALAVIVKRSAVSGGAEMVDKVKLFANELAEAVDIASADPSFEITPAGYSNIRECLGHLVGCTIEDITQQDAEEWAETRRSYIQLLLSNGSYLKIYVGPYGFEYEGFSDEADEDG